MPSGVKAHIAIFASGGGSNADKICAFFETHPDISVDLIVSHKAKAGVLKVADRHGIDSVSLSRKYWQHPEIILPVLETSDITHILLAGFLSLIPAWLIEAYKNRIINIHPALLPQHGGKGMYGHHVHEAVKQAGELITGITIHEVNEHYDEGKVIFRKEVELEAEDTPEEIARKVLQVEHMYYAQVIEGWINSQRDTQ